MAVGRRSIITPYSLLRIRQTRLAAPPSPPCNPPTSILPKTRRRRPSRFIWAFVWARALRTYLKTLEQIGVNHVALNLRFNQLDIETTLKRLADELLADFS